MSVELGHGPVRVILKSRIANVAATPLLMTQNVHGHEILEHLIAAGGGLSLDQLRAFARDGHGSDATYYTCSAAGMSFDELISFLVARSKVSISEGTITVHAQNMCHHEGGDGNHVH